MKSNLVIIGENENTNKSVADKIAVILELNFLDFDDYCDYINIVTRQEVIQKFGKRKYNELQKEALPHMQNFCDSVIGFDGKMSRLPSVFRLLKDSAYIVCIASNEMKKYKKYADIWVDIQDKSQNRIVDEIVKKLGEI